MVGTQAVSDRKARAELRLGLGLCADEVEAASSLDAQLVLAGVVAGLDPDPGRGVVGVPDDRAEPEPKDHR